MAGEPSQTLRGRSIRSTPASRPRKPRTNKRTCGIQPAHQSLITDVFRSRPLLCTIHHLINFALVRVENAQSCPRCLTKDIRVSGPSGGRADGLLSAMCRDPARY